MNVPVQCKHFFSPKWRRAASMNVFAWRAGQCDATAFISYGNPHCVTTAMCNRWLSNLKINQVQLTLVPIKWRGPERRSCGGTADEARPLNICPCDLSDNRTNQLTLIKALCVITARAYQLQLGMWLFFTFYCSNTCLWGHLSQERVSR